MKPESWKTVLKRRKVVIDRLVSEKKIRAGVVWFSDYTEEERKLIRDAEIAIRGDNSHIG